MKKQKSKLAAATAVAFVLATVPAYADAGYMLGVSWNFGSGTPKLGVTAKILSSDMDDEFVGVAGVTYFIDDASIGFDAGMGYNFDGRAVAFTYDFTHNSPQISVGRASTKNKIDSVC